MSCTSRGRAHKWHLFPTPFPPKQHPIACLELEGVVEKATRSNSHFYQKVPTTTLSSQIKQGLHICNPRADTLFWVVILSSKDTVNPHWGPTDLAEEPADREVTAAGQSSGRTAGTSPGVGHRQHAVLNTPEETYT